MAGDDGIAMVEMGVELREVPYALSKWLMSHGVSLSDVEIKLVVKTPQVKRLIVEAARYEEPPLEFPCNVSHTWMSLGDLDPGRDTSIGRPEPQFGAHGVFDLDGRTALIDNTGALWMFDGLMLRPVVCELTPPSSPAEEVRAFMDKIVPTVHERLPADTLVAENLAMQNHKPQGCPPSVPPTGRPRAGDVFKHYKGGKYVVVDIALREEDLEPMVIYKPWFGEAQTGPWVRTLTGFMEEVEVDGGFVRQRFEPMPHIPNNVMPLSDPFQGQKS